MKVVENPLSGVVSPKDDIEIVLLIISSYHIHTFQSCERLRLLKRHEDTKLQVSSSAMLHHCRSCVFTLAAKQLRLHSSDTVALHLHSL